MKYILKKSTGEYLLREGGCTTNMPDIAHRYSLSDALKHIQTHKDLTAVSVSTDAADRATCEDKDTIASLGRQVDILKDVCARLTAESSSVEDLTIRFGNQRDTIVRMQRQNGDLLAANNALLQRARDAEDNLKALVHGRETPTWIGKLAKEVHAENEKWWTDPATGARIERNKGEMIALMHSELSEMLEGVRKDSMDDHLPQMKSEVVELADLFIRGLDYAGAYQLPLADAIASKRAYNRTRLDHTHAARLAVNGKKF